MQMLRSFQLQYALCTCQMHACIISVSPVCHAVCLRLRALGGLSVWKQMQKAASCLLGASARLCAAEGVPSIMSVIWKLLVRISKWHQSCMRYLVRGQSMTKNCSRWLKGLAHWFSVIFSTTPTMRVWMCQLLARQAHSWCLNIWCSGFAVPCMPNFSYMIELPCFNIAFPCCLHVMLAYYLLYILYKVADHKTYQMASALLLRCWHLPGVGFTLSVRHVGYLYWVVQ